MAYQLDSEGHKKWSKDSAPPVPEKITECISTQFSGVEEETWSKMPPSVGWMFIQPCNFSCGFCFARFDDLKEQYLNKEENLRLTHLLAQKFDKVTFLGGEPTLAPYLLDMCKIAKSYGKTTAIITNGWCLTEEYLTPFKGWLDWVTISLDSAIPEVHAKLGRGFRNGEKPLTNEHYLRASEAISKAGMKLKISTVVTKLNKDEDMSEFIRDLNPCRWKIFQCLYIEGENDGRVDEFLITKDELQEFLKRHEKLTNDGIKMYASTEDTKNGYACITPAGCFLDDGENIHKYSRPILEVGVDEAWKDIDYKPENFRARGGMYDWKATQGCSMGGVSSRDIEDIGIAPITTEKKEKNQTRKVSTRDKQQPAVPWWNASAIFIPAVLFVALLVSIIIGRL